MVKLFPIIVKHCADTVIYTQVRFKWLTDLRAFIDRYWKDVEIPTPDEVESFVKGWRMKGPFSFVAHQFRFSNLVAYTKDARQDSQFLHRPQFHISQAMKKRISNAKEHVGTDGP